jgi:hypothetical protein
MKTKNIALIVIFSSLITSNHCSGMNYMSNSYNSATTMLSNNMIRARNWTNNFINSCRDISVLGTIYATLGIYDFNEITGLDENKLNSYNSAELKNAMQRVDKMAQYGASSPKLEIFFDKLEKQYLIAQSKELYPTETTEDLDAEQKAAFEEIEKEINEK